MLGTDQSSPSITRLLSFDCHNSYLAFALASCFVMTPPPHLHMGLDRLMVGATIYVGLQGQRYDGYITLDWLVIRR